MEQQPNDNKSGRSYAIAILLGVSIASTIGMVIWWASGNIGVAVGVAGGISLLVVNILRKVIK